MNDTAKKLREAAEYIGDGETCSDTAIVTVREMFDVGRADTFGGDLGRVLVAIADELDKLQTKANEANNLRQQLESAEDKAERRKRHIGHLETALHDKNALLEQRGWTIARLMAECSELRELRGKVSVERERQILDMWPRFEDGEPVWYGDEVDNIRSSVIAVEFFDGSITMSSDFDHLHLSFGERVKRPAPKVLDADGVEIHVGDTVWHCNGIASGVVTSIDAGSLMNTTRYVDESGTEFRDAARSLTHTRPDSWERLEEDAELNDETGLVGGNLDIVRRAKALAGVEVD